MSSDSKFELLQRKLFDHFGVIEPESVPIQREMSRWRKDNLLGFLTGTSKYGSKEHLGELYEILCSDNKEQIHDALQEFIKKMYASYVMPFKEQYGSCAGTPGESSSESDYNPDPHNFSHKDFKKALVKRDEFCMFCWERFNLQGAHIIAQNNSDFSLYERGGLTSTHQVQNGLLLCLYCHTEFHGLRSYVETSADKFILKGSHYDDEVSEWNFERTKASRSFWKSRFEQLSNRNVVEADGQIALYFMDDTESLKPSKAALQLHETACLIWRMAGGADPDDEDCPDDDDADPVRVFDNQADNVLKWIRTSLPEASIAPSDS